MAERVAEALLLLAKDALHAFAQFFARPAPVNQLEDGPQQNLGLFSSSILFIYSLRFSGQWSRFLFVGIMVGDCQRA